MPHEIDFDKELGKGRTTYNKTLGVWWRSRSEDRAHARAYTTVARFARQHAPHAKTVVDYACGNGSLLKKVEKFFPSAKMVGIDGSSLLLNDAKKILPHATFIETHLPDFSLETKEDLIIFCFPNIVPNPQDQPYYDEHGYEDEADQKVAKYLASAREEDPDEETVEDDEETLMDTLLTNKVISRNLRSLLKKGGYCIRVEYANASRDELTKLVEARTAFEEGSLKEIDGKKPVQLFEKVSSQFFKSKVIEDVYHQTKNEDDLEGGYFITLLKAI